MSYLLEFPPSTLPLNALSPPYVVFAIWNEDVVQELPPQIPLNAVLHFVPKLTDWLLPAPSTAALPKPLARQALCSPYVGINILSDEVTPVGLKWVTKKIIQASGLAYPKTLFLTQPSVCVAVSIYRTWLALELPIAGVTNLLTHIQYRLMMGPPVTNWEMNMLWRFFPHDSAIVREMGLNSIRSHLNFDYAPSDTAALLEWYWVNDERRQFFNSIEHMFPDITKEQDQAAKVNNCGKTSFLTTVVTELGKSQERTRPANKKGRDSTEKVTALLEKNATRKISPNERKERQSSDTKALQTRLRRIHSDDSLRSVETAIWDPQEEEKQPGTAKNGASDRKPSSMIVGLRLRSKVLEAENDRVESMSRGRQRTRSYRTSTLSAEQFAFVTETMGYENTAASSKARSHGTSARRRSSSRAREEQFTVRTRAQSSASSSASAHTEKSLATANEDDSQPQQLRSLDLLKLRKSKTIRKQSGREGLGEAKRETLGRKMPFGHDPYRGSETAQGSINGRRSGTLVHLSSTVSIKPADDDEERGGRGEKRLV